MSKALKRCLLLLRVQFSHNYCNLQTTIATLEEQTLMNLVGRIWERDLTFVFDVLNESSQNERRQGYHSQPSDGVPSWCTCNHCREIPSDIEKLCCGQTSTSSCFNSSFKILKLTYRRLNILNLTKLCTKQCLSCFQDFQRVVFDDLVFL